MRRFWIGAAIFGLAVLVSTRVGRAHAPQTRTTEIDSTLLRIYGTALRASDVREARMLKLVPEAGGGDEAVQRALENRLLILNEMKRAPAADPGRDAVAARRQTWAASWPAGTDLPALMAKTGTTDQALDTWFRGDLQIAAFLDARFGQAGDPSREAKLNEWIAELRRRANLRQP
jgi:hypothetical protein